MKKFDKKKVLILCLAIFGFIVNLTGMAIMIYIAMNQRADLSGLLYGSLAICLFGCLCVMSGIVLFVKYQKEQTNE